MFRRIGDKAYGFLERIDGIEANTLTMDLDCITIDDARHAEDRLSGHHAAAEYTHHDGDCQRQQPNHHMSLANQRMRPMMLISSATPS